MNRYATKMLRPYAKYVRQCVDRARGLTRTSLTHAEIAALVKKPNPTILEIGSNDGSDTVRFLAAMPEARIYCFEPDPRAVARFKKRLMPQPDTVKLFEAAVSDRTGRIDFHMSDGTCAGWDSQEGWDLSGSIRRPANHLKEYPWVTFVKTITVDSCRLDDWCAEHGVNEIDFIWMDVQGAEGDVIMGAQRILQSTRFVYTEYSNKNLYEGQLPLRKLLALLSSFEVIIRYPDDVLLRNKKIA